MANTYLKEMAREREKFLHSPTSRLRQASQLCSCKSSKYKDMRHGKHVPQGDGKREEKRGHFFQNSHFPIFPSSHITKNKCNKKDNILIYNDLYKNAISHWEDGKMGKWEKCYKDFSNGHTFSDKQTTANFTPLFLKILQIQQHEAWQT